jgi:hypothetical protein
MFQTSHPWAAFHAAARCVSGGPIYFTDSPGKHNVPLIHEMTAKTCRGDTVILRPPHPGKSSNAYIGYDEQKLLKIETYVGMAKTGVSILGVFNVCQNPLTEMVMLSDFPGTESGEYVIRSHVSGGVSKPSTRKNGKAIVTEELGVKGYDILSAYPVRRFSGKNGDISVAVLGLLGKMSGAAAIVNQDVYIEENGRVRAWVSLKALGIYGKSNKSPACSFLRLDFINVLAHSIHQVSGSTISRPVLSRIHSWASCLANQSRSHASKRVNKIPTCSK